MYVLYNSTYVTKHVYTWVYEYGYAFVQYMFQLGYHAQAVLMGEGCGLGWSWVSDVRMCRWVYSKV